MRDGTIPNLTSLFRALAVDDITDEELAAGETRESIEAAGDSVDLRYFVRRGNLPMKVHNHRDPAGWQEHEWTIRDSEWDLAMDYEDAREYAEELLRGAAVAEVLNGGRLDETLHSLHDEDPDSDPWTLLTDERDGVAIESDSGAPWHGRVEYDDGLTSDAMRRIALELFRQAVAVDLLNGELP